MSDDELNGGNRSGEESDFTFDEADEFKIPGSPDDADESSDPLLGSLEEEDEVAFDPDTNWGLDEIDQQEPALIGDQDNGYAHQGVAGGGAEADEGDAPDGDGYPDNAESERVTMGWKVWAALGALMVGVFVGIMMLMGMFSGDTPQSQQASTDTEQTAQQSQGGQDSSGQEQSSGGDAGAEESEAADANDNDTPSESQSSDKGSEQASSSDPAADDAQGDEAAQQQSQSGSDQPSFDDGGNGEQSASFDPEQGESQSGRDKGNGNGNGDGGGGDRSNDQAGSAASDDPVAAGNDNPIEGLEKALGDNTEQISALESSVDDTGGDIRDGFGDMGQQFNNVTDRLAEIRDEIREIDARKDRANDEKESADNNRKAEGESSEGSQETATVRDTETAQIRLAAFGYQPGPIDGEYGPKTKAAVERFQQTHGIERSGKLDEPTMDQLFSGDVERYAGAEKQERNHGSESSPSSHASSDDGGDREQTGDSKWYVRGVTASRAILYQADGSSYVVSQGTEVPGKGQVSKLNPDQHTVTLVGGETIRRR